MVHYFCDILALLRLTHTHTDTVEMVLYAYSTPDTFLPTLVILTSDGSVPEAIRRAAKHDKTLSTWTSHFLAIPISQCTEVSTYVQPHSPIREVGGQRVSVFCTILVLVLNPFIYSFQSSEVQLARQRRLKAGTLLC